MMAPGRPIGSKNAPGHQAGGSRPNAGRKRARISDPPPDLTSTSTTTASGKS